MKTQVTQPRPPSVMREPVQAQDMLVCMLAGVMASKHICGVVDIGMAKERAIRRTGMRRPMLR
jgi:hypothetical protein